MKKFSRYGKNEWKRKAMNAFMYFFILLIIICIIAGGYRFLFPKYKIDHLQKKNFDHLTVAKSSDSKVSIVVEPIGLNLSSFQEGDLSYIPIGWSIFSETGECRGRGSLMYDKSAKIYYRNIKWTSSVPAGKYRISVSMYEQIWDGQKWIPSNFSFELSKSLEFFE